jgi:hypothetical protein
MAGDPESTEIDALKQLSSTYEAERTWSSARAIWMASIGTAGATAAILAGLFFAWSYYEKAVQQISVFQSAPPEIVELQARLDRLETRVQQIDERLNQARVPSPTEPRKWGWELLRVGGDCSGEDIGMTETAVPDDAKCRGANVTAVCWDGNLFRNGPNPWCTYKSIAPEACVGGGAPGRLYRCVPRQ